MRPVLIAIVALFAVVAADAGRAQESFFNKRYCTMGGSDNSSGMPDCSYNTWEQCQASARGLARYCSENPNWRSQGASGSEGTPRRRKVRE